MSVTAVLSLIVSYAGCVY